MAVPETIPASIDTAQTRSRLRFFWPAVLLLVFMAQCLWFINTQSITTDEPGQITSGIENWKYGRFGLLLDHPPLGRKIMTAPLYFFTKADVDLVHWKAEDIPINFRPEHLKWVRYVVMLMGVLLGIALWSVCAKVFSDSAAAFALALFCFSPSL